MAIRARLTVIATAAILVATTSSAYCTTYYVEVTGSDFNTGTRSSPFATLQKAANVVRPGDTVIVGDGEYTSPNHQFIDMARAGNSGGWITFRSRNRFGAKLNGQNRTKYMLIFRPHRGSFVRFLNFDIYGFRDVGIVTSLAHDIEIVGNKIHHIGRRCSDSDYGFAGIYGRASYNVKIEANIFHDIGRFGPGENGCNPEQPYWQNHDHGIYLDGGTNVAVVGNTFQNILRGWGLHAYSSGGAILTQLRVAKNIFYGNNPNRDGNIILASTLRNSTLTDNVFYEPRNVAVVLQQGNLVTYSNVLVSDNITYRGSISAISPPGVTFLGNRSR